MRAGAAATAATKLPAGRPRSPCCGRLAAPAGQEELRRRLPRLRLDREGKGRTPPHPDPPARGSTPGPTPTAYPRPGAGSSPARGEGRPLPDPAAPRRCPRRSRRRAPRRPTGDSVAPWAGGSGRLGPASARGIIALRALRCWGAGKSGAQSCPGTSVCQPGQRAPR